MSTKFNVGDLVQGFYEGKIFKEKGIFRIESYKGGKYHFRKVEGGDLMSAPESNLIKYEAEPAEPAEPAEQVEKVEPEFDVGDKVKFEFKGEIIYGTITKIKLDKQQAEVELDVAIKNKTNYSLPLDKLKKIELLMGVAPATPIQPPSPKRVSPKAVLRTSPPKPFEPEFKSGDRVEFEYKEKTIYGIIIKTNPDKQQAEVKLDEKLKDKIEYKIPFDKLKKSGQIILPIPPPVSPKRVSPKKPVSPKRVSPKKPVSPKRVSPKKPVSPKLIVTIKTPPRVKTPPKAEVFKARETALHREVVESKQQLLEEFNKCLATLTMV